MVSDDRAWGPAQQVETDNDDAGRQDVAVAPSGDATVVWSVYEGAQSDIWARRYLADSGWDTATLIETDDAGDANGAQVAVDASGNATVVWAESDGNGLETVWANRFEIGSGWGTAALIGTDDVGPEAYPVVTVDVDGNATAVWARWVDGLQSVWANRYVPGSGWGAATRIETDAANFGGPPQVAVDPAGNVTVVWNGTGYVWANRFEPGSGWGTASRIETDNAGSAGYPQLAVDASGTVTAAWGKDDGQRDNLWASQYVPGSSWGTPTLVETDDTATAFNPKLAVDPTGSVTAVWVQHDYVTMLDSVWGSRYVPGAGWGTAVLLATDANGQQVAVDDAGNATAIWSGASLEISTFVPGTGWGAAATLAAGAGDPQIAVAPSGDAIVVWYQNDGTRSNIWYSLFQ